MTRIERLARFARRIHHEDAPASVQSRLRMQSLSVLGASAAARHADDAAPALRVAALSPGDLPVLPGLPRLDLRGAIRAASTLSLVHDHDDYLLCGHTGHSAHWAVWLVASSRGASWDDTLSAQLAVNEVLARLGGMAILGRSNGQAWIFLQTVGGALAAGLLHGLDERRLAHAMALALQNAPICDWRSFRGGGKAHLIANPLLAGLDAAALAAEGADGPIDLLEEGSDLLAALTGGRPAFGWIDTLEDTWLTETLAIKARPGCAYLLSAVEALEQIHQELLAERGQGLQAQEVLRIDVDAALPTFAMERLFGPSPSPGPSRIEPVAVNFSVARSLALWLIRGSLTPRDLRLHVLGQVHREMTELVPRIHVHHDVKLTWQTAARLQEHLPFDRLVGGAGAAALASALAERAPEFAPGLAELPGALASEFAGALAAWRPGSPVPGLGEATRIPQLAAGGLGRLAGWAGRQVDRLVAPPPPAHPTTRDLSHFVFPLPARVRVLLHGGTVREAEVLIPAGAPGRPENQRRRLARQKCIDGYQELGAEAAAAGVAHDWLPEEGPLPAPPGDGPGEILERLAG